MLIIILSVDHQTLHPLSTFTSRMAFIVLWSTFHAFCDVPL